MNNDMDFAKTITHVSLCAGYGGIDLGLKRAIPDLRTVAFSEIEAFACANLVSKMEAGLLDAAPIWTNLKTFPWESFRGRVDLLSGGYPCQPFSAAGKRLGTDDPRHLWPFIADGIARMQPGMCFFENVEGHISLGLREVVGELESLGYRATWGVFSASEVGAPHQRKRVFILAYRHNAGLEGWDGRIMPERASECFAWPSRPSVQQHAWEPPRTVANASNNTGQRWGALGAVPCVNDGASRPSEASGSVGTDEAGVGAQPQSLCCGAESSMGHAALMLRNGGDDNAGSSEQSKQVPQSRDASGETDNRIRQTQPPLGRDADGPTYWMDYAELHRSSDNRTDELRLLGNGVVPATAERAFLTLFKRFHDQHQR